MRCDRCQAKATASTAHGCFCDACLEALVGSPPPAPLPACPGCGLLADYCGCVRVLAGEAPKPVKPGVRSSLNVDATLLAHAVVEEE